MNSRIGRDTTDYSQATELLPLKFPRNSLPVSDRYDIPELPANNKGEIITDIKPPDY